jgi:hypothetical protein
VKDTIDERVRNQFAYYQRIARGAGYEVTLTRIGEEPSARRGRRADAETRSRQSGRGTVEPKYRNPDNPAETVRGAKREEKEPGIL